MNLARWEGAFGLDPEERFFEGWREMPAFTFPSEGFDASTAWWLAELCRLAYTPDHREAPRDRCGRLPDREVILQERSPFEEVRSFHKTGNHASIHRLRSGRGGSIVCFRGTSNLRQWIMNTLIRPHGWRRFRVEGDPEDGFVHSGFYVLHKRLWPLIGPALSGLPRPWIFSGHSLGGALALIAGVVERPELVCTFGAPKVGNAVFNDLVDRRRLWRIVNEVDLVPRLPLPDPRQGARTLAHGRDGRRLDATGGWSVDYDSGDEDELPFAVRDLAREVSRPPEWLTSHRVNEYCRRLRKAVLGGGKKLSDGPRKSD